MEKHMYKSALNCAELLNDPVTGAEIILKSGHKEELVQFKQLLEKSNLSKMQDLISILKQNGHNPEVSKK